MKPVTLHKLREQLIMLAERHHTVALKTGTEVEDMGREEIALMRTISADIVPIIVKIGGPEARTDMRMCLDLGIDGVLAPMVETLYALTNFTSAIRNVCVESRRELPYLAMNLESITACQNLDTMIESEAFRMLNQVTIGRGDLSGSMHMNVDDEEVMRVSAAAIRKLRARNVVTSVGGGLQIGNIDGMIARLNPHRFNTRHTVLENSPAFQRNAKLHLMEALLFEKNMYSLFAASFPGRADYYQNRVDVLQNRMGNIELRRAMVL